VRGAGAGRGSRGSRRNDRRGTPSEAGASSVAMTRGEAEALGALVKTAVLLLVALSSTDEAGVVKLGMRWGEDRVGLV